jgi:hypothetical protein
VESEEPHEKKSKQDVAEPNRTTDRTETLLPIWTKSTVDRALPSLPKDRMDSDEPRVYMSNIDKPVPTRPNRAFSFTEMDFPTRAIPRIDKLLPLCTMSRTDILPPTLVNERRESAEDTWTCSPTLKVPDATIRRPAECPIDKPLPTRANCRMESDDPSVKYFNTEIADPIRLWLRKEYEEARCKKSRIDTAKTEPHAQHPYAETVEPIRTAVRTDTLLPMRKKSSTEDALPILAKFLSDRLLPRWAQPRQLARNCMNFLPQFPRDNDDPMREKLRSERDEPHWKKSTIDILEILLV